VERHPDVFAFSVSHTTRAPRPGEKHGVDYHYVSMPDFETLIAEDGFVEHAKFGDNRYGTSKMTSRPHPYHSQRQHCVFLSASCGWSQLRNGVARGPRCG